MERHKRNTEHTNVPQEGDDYTLSHDTPVEVPQQGIEEAVTAMPEEATDTADTPKERGVLSETGTITLDGQVVAIDVYSQPVSEEWVRFTMVNQETDEVINSELYPTWQRLK